jgi:hypothetical protein
MGTALVPACLSGLSYHAHMPAGEQQFGQEHRPAPLAAKQIFSAGRLRHCASCQVLEGDSALETGSRRELDLTETAVREWVKRADLDAGRRSDGLTTAEREELRRENRELREEREILRKAAVFFARETDHR